MTLASRDVRFENTTVHLDVIDAMLRQPRSDAVLPFRDHRLTSAGGTVAAVDYDLGPSGLAYGDKDIANLHVSTGRGGAHPVEHGPNLSQRRRGHRPRS